LGCASPATPLRREPHPPERLAEMQAALARMEAEGGTEIID
jgi:hypothetical protein